MLTLETTGFLEDRDRKGNEPMITRRTLLNTGVAALISVAAIALTFGNAMAQFAYLAGQWISQYQCPSGQFYPLTVQIDQTGQQIKAVKITGDPCVAAGQTAFYGNLTGNFGQLSCAYVAGPSLTPPPKEAWEAILHGLANALTEPTYTIGWTSGTLRVIDANSIEACTLQFARSGAGTPAYGSSTPWQNPGTTQVVGPWVQLQKPVVSHDVPNQKLIVRVNGKLGNAYGANARLAVYFDYQYGQNWVRLTARPTDTDARDNQGNVSAWRNFSVQFDPYDTGVLYLELPYHKLNLAGPPYPGQPGIIYNLKATAYVEVNDRSLGASPAAYFDYQQN